MPGADWVAKVVTVGPPCLLVIGLLIILQAAARSKIQIGQAAMLSGIVAVFFGLWIKALPELRTRRIEIVTSMTPSEFRTAYSLRPIRYSIEEMKDLKESDLDSSEFDFPANTDRLRLHFNLAGLTQSYRNNLETVIGVAQTDPACFEKAIRGRDYSRVAASIVTICPGSVAAASPAPALAELGG